MKEKKEKGTNEQNAKQRNTKHRQNNIHSQNYYTCNYVCNTIYTSIYLFRNFPPIISLLLKNTEKRYKTVYIIHHREQSVHSEYLIIIEVRPPH